MGIAQFQGLTHQSSQDLCSKHTLKIHLQIQNQACLLNRMTLMPIEIDFQ